MQLLILFKFRFSIFAFALSSIEEWDLRFIFTWINIDLFLELTQYYILKLTIGKFTLKKWSEDFFYYILQYVYIINRCYKMHSVRVSFS